MISWGLGVWILDRQKRGSSVEVLYREAVGEEDGAAGVGESHEELLLGQRIGWELPVRERGQVARQQAGPDGVGISRGAKRRRDRGGAVRASVADRRSSGRRAISQRAGAVDSIVGSPRLFLLSVDSMRLG